ncbi:hypothetical protein, partial [Xanthovirga aplysinae]|uniref:hypothetical protein n=1 Tax=Xanthovirga aplysinae TaxID=2529853 RepID=UPI001656C1A4
IFNANAQTDKELKKIKKHYPEERAVYLQNISEITISFENEKVSVESTQLEEMLHLKDQSVGLARNAVYSSEFIKLTGLEAETRVFNASQSATQPFEIMKVDEFMEKNDNDYGVFYDDQKMTTFIFPAVQPGARTIVRSKHQITEPRLLGSFFFQSHVPVV